MLEHVTGSLIKIPFKKVSTKNVYYGEFKHKKGHRARASNLTSYRKIHEKICENTCSRKMLGYRNTVTVLREVKLNKARFNTCLH